MGALRLALFLVFLGHVTRAEAGPVETWANHIGEASARFGIPEPWIRRVMRAESGGRTQLGGRPILSQAGAMGLMQLMPGTWREMRALVGLGVDPHDPRDNILAGTAYLRMMYDQFGYPGLFAAYNAGPARYSQHLATGRRLPRETVSYVAKVAGEIGHAFTLRAQSPARPEEARAALFALRPIALSPGTSAERASPSSAIADLFVPLSRDPLR